MDRARCRRPSRNRVLRLSLRRDAVSGAPWPHRLPGEVSVVIERRERVPGNLPKIMPVGILEVSRMAAPEDILRRLDDGPAGAFGFVKHRGSDVAPLPARFGNPAAARVSGAMPASASHADLSACLPARQAGGNDKWKIPPKNPPESPMKSPCKGVARGVHGRFLMSIDPACPDSRFRGNDGRERVPEGSRWSPRRMGFHPCPATRRLNSASSRFGLAGRVPR